MPVEVRIPTVLRSHVGGAPVVEGPTGVLRDLLAGLGAKYPGLAEQIFADGGELHRFVNVYVNDEDVRYVEGLDTKVTDGDVVSILPAVAGGRL
jgi:MoaD family protein